MTSMAYDTTRCRHPRDNEPAAHQSPADQPQLIGSQLAGGQLISDQLLSHALLRRPCGYLVVIHDPDGDRYWSGHLVDDGDSRVCWLVYCARQAGTEDAGTELAPVTVYATPRSARSAWTRYLTRRAGRGTPVTEETSVVGLADILDWSLLR